MTALIKAWADFTIAYRLPIIVGSIALLLVALLTGKDIPFDNSSERYFVAGDPTALEYDNLIELFGDNEYLIVGFEATSSESDIFNAGCTVCFRRTPSGIGKKPFSCNFQLLFTVIGST